MIVIYGQTSRNSRVPLLPLGPYASFASQWSTPSIPLQHSTKLFWLLVTFNFLHSVSALQLSSNLISQQPWKNYLKKNIFLPCPPWSLTLADLSLCLLPDRQFLFEIWLLSPFHVKNLQVYKIIVTTVVKFAGHSVPFF